MFMFAANSQDTRSAVEIPDQDTDARLLELYGFVPLFSRGDATISLRIYQRSQDLGDSMGLFLIVHQVGIHSEGRCFASAPRFMEGLRGPLEIIQMHLAIPSLT